MPFRAIHRSPVFARALGVLTALAFALRAIIPTGYMIAAVDGHARLVICPAGLHFDRTAHHHHLGAAPAHAAGMVHTTDLCPFALAGGPGLTGAAPDPAQRYFVLLQRPPIVAFATVASSPPPRHQAPRGPPAPV